MELSRLVVGTDLDREGHVLTPRTRFHQESNDLHVDLYVSNAQTGAKTELIMEHLESKTRVPPVDTRIEDSGDTVLSFIFTPPNHGWPKGTYRLIARSSNGRERSQEFHMD